MARWSSGQDGGLSRPNREFDSPSGHQQLCTISSVGDVRERRRRRSKRAKRSGSNKATASESEDGAAVATGRAPDSEEGAGKRDR